jgi:hypothetical protein
MDRIDRWKGARACFKFILVRPRPHSFRPFYAGLCSIASGDDDDNNNNVVVVV